MLKHLLIIMCSAIPIFSLTYSTNDRYVSSDYTSQVINVNSISELNGKPGTHNHELNTYSMRHLNSHIESIINIYDGNQLLASGYLFSGHGDNDPWSNVVVVGDGYDPNNERKIDAVVSDPNYNLIFSVDQNNTPYAPICNGYDMIFVDFEDGTGDMRTNSKAYLKILEEVNKRTSNSIVAAGNSMGGMIARLALLYGEKEIHGKPCAQIDQVTKLVVIDTPLKGASALPISLQSFVKDKREELYNSSINTAAAKQLFYEHLNGGHNYSEEFNKFQNFIHGMGDYPQNVKKYSLANANWKQPYSYSKAEYKLDVKINYGIWKRWYLSPPVPGMSNWWYNSNTKTMNYETITFSGHDLAPGSVRNTILELDNDIVPMLNAANLVLDLESNFLSIIGKSSTALSTGLVKIRGTSLHTSLTPSDFKPTHVPIYSAFDLEESTPGHLKNANSLNKLCEHGYSPFDKLYLCSERYDHISYNREFCSIIMNVLNDKVQDISPIINFIVNRNNY